MRTTFFARSPSYARSGWVTCDSDNPPPSCPAAKLSVSSWHPNSSVLNAATRSTSSTSPLLGLHPSDSDRLLAHAQGLVDADNTVVMVELDMRVVAQADHVIDLGPGAGADGGRIVATGSPEQVAATADSATAPYLRAALENTGAGTTQH